MHGAARGMQRDTWRGGRPGAAIGPGMPRQGLDAQSLHEFVKAELPTLLDVLAPSNDATGIDDDDGCAPRSPRDRDGTQPRP
jgi:hypothetical protein